MSLVQPRTLQRLPLNSALGMVGGITRARATRPVVGRHFSRRPARGEGLLPLFNTIVVSTLYVVWGCALAPALPREQLISLEALSLCLDQEVG